MSEDTNRDMEIRLAFEQQICNMRVEVKMFSSRLFVHSEMILSTCQI